MSSSSAPYVTPRDLTAPPVRVDVPLDDMTAPVTGRRVALFTAEGTYARDLIAVAEPETDALNQRVVRLAQEEDWWTWRVAVNTGGEHGEWPRNCRFFPTWAVVVENARLLPRQR